MSKNIVVLETWFQRVWHEEDERAIDELFAPDANAKGLGLYVKDGNESFSDHERIGPEAFKEFQRALLGLVGNVKLEITMHMSDGDWLSALCVFKATKRGTDQPVQMTGTVFCRIQDDRIAEAYNHFDFMSIFAQLGQLGENAFERCMSGENSNDN